MEKYLMDIKSNPNESIQQKESLVLKSCFKHNPNLVLSPTIFTKTKLVDKNQRQKTSKQILVLEHLLAIVVQTYYSQQFQLEDIIQEIQSQQLQLQRLNKSQKKYIKKSQKKKSDSSIKIRNGSVSQQESEDEVQNGILNDKNILDYILSPLKDDYEFEMWSIKHIAIFECCLCLFGQRFELIQVMVFQKDPLKNCLVNM